MVGIVSLGLEDLGRGPVEELVAGVSRLVLLEPQHLAEMREALGLARCTVPLGDQLAKGLVDLPLHGDDPKAICQPDQNQRVGLARIIATSPKDCRAKPYLSLEGRQLDEGPLEYWKGSSPL